MHFQARPRFLEGANFSGGLEIVPEHAVVPGDPQSLLHPHDGPHEMGALVPGIVVERKIPGRRQVFPGGGSLAFRRRQAAGSVRRVRNDGVITIVVHALHQGKGVAAQERGT